MTASPTATSTASPDGFLLSLLAALQPGTDPWDDLQRVLSAHGIDVQASSSTPNWPRRLFNRDGQLIAKQVTDWRGREALIHHYRVQHCLTITDPAQRPAGTWQRYLQRIAAAQLQQAKGLADPLQDRARSVAFGDPRVAYLVSVAGNRLPYQLGDAYTPLLRSALGKYTATRKRPAVHDQDTPGLLFEAIVGITGQGYRTDGYVDIARFLQRSIPQRIKALHRSLECTGATLVTMAQAGDYGEKGPLSPASIFGTDDPPTLEEQIDALAEQAAEPHREGFFSLLPARMEQDQEDRLADVLWESLLAVARTDQERQLVDAFRATGPRPKLAEIAKSVGMAQRTIYEKWDGIQARARTAAAVRRAARVIALSSARWFWLRSPRLPGSAPAPPLVQFSPVRTSGVDIDLTRIWSLVELSRRGPIPLRQGRGGEALTGLATYPQHIREAAERIRLRDQIQYPEGVLDTAEGTVWLGPPVKFGLSPTVKRRVRRSRHNTKGPLATVNVSSVHGTCNQCGEQPHSVLVPVRGGPILCAKHALVRDEIKITFPLSRFSPPWESLGTTIIDNPSITCAACGGLVAKEATYQRCLLCGRGQDVGGSDHDTALQAMIDRDLRSRFCYFQQPRRSSRTIQTSHAK